MKPVDIVIGVDPSMRHNAACVLDLLAGVYEPWGFGFIEELSRCEILAEIGERAREGRLRVFALIECPTWSGPGTREVRSAALIWERTFKREFPRREVRRVDPRVWQRALLSGLPGSTKDQSLFRAGRLLGRPALSDHEADAACVCEYARLMAAGLVGR